MSRTSKNLVLLMLAGAGLLPVSLHAATVSWKSAQDGNWSDGTRWSTGSPPGPRDAAVIIISGSLGYTVTLDTPAEVSSLNLGASSGTTTQTLATDGNRLTLDGASKVNLDGVLNAANSTVQGKSLANNGVLSLGGTTLSGITINNSGTAVLIGGQALTLASAAIFNNLAAGVFNNNGTTTTLTAMTGGTAGTFNNAGVFNYSQPQGSTLYDVLFNNSGTLNVGSASTSGELGLNENGAHKGNFAVAGSSSALNLVGGVHTLNAGATISGTGTVVVSASGFASIVVPAAALVTVSGHLDVQANSLTLPGILSVAAAGTLSQEAGAVSIPSTGNLNVTGAANLLGGSLVSPDKKGHVTILKGGSLQLSGSTLDGITLNNGGAGQLLGSGVTFADGAVLNNLAAATFGDLTPLSNGPVISGAYAGVVNNSGVWNITHLAGSGSYVYYDIPFNNTGTLNALNDQTNLYRSGTHTGVFNVGSGAVLDFAGGVHTLNSGASFTGSGRTELDAASTAALNIPAKSVVSVSGNVDLMGGALNDGGTLNVTGSFTNDGTAATTVTGAVSVSGSLSLNNGVVSIPSAGAVSVSGAINLVGGTLISPDQKGLVGVTKTGTLSFSGTGALLDGITINNSGSATTGVAAAVGFQNGANFQNLAGATFTGADQSIFYGTAIGLTPSIVNAGTLNIGDASGPGMTSLEGVNLTQKSTGVLNIRLNGTDPNIPEFDQISSAAAVLGGKLNVTIAKGFTPSIGDSYSIVDYSGATGAFATSSGLTIPGGLVLTPSQGATAFTLSVIPTPLSVVLSPATIYGGSPSQGTVTVDGPAQSGGTVVVLSSNSLLAGVPSSVTIPAGSSSATFNITSKVVSATTVATLTAASGGAAKTAALTLDVPVLKSITLRPATVVGGGLVTGTVTLSIPAPAGGVQVHLTSSSGGVTPSSAVFVAAGAVTGSFMVHTVSVGVSETVTISGSYEGVTQTAALTVTP